MKRNYKTIAFVGLFAALLSQIAWLYQSITFTTNEIKNKANDELNIAMFREAEIRACHAMTPITISEVNDAIPDITMFEAELYKATKTNPNLNTIDSLLHNKMSETSYVIYYIKKGNVLSQTQKAKSWFSVKTDVIYTRVDKTEGVYMELSNPYSLFFKRLGFIMVASIFMLIITTVCIIKQINIIRIQRKTMQLRKDFTYAMIHDMKSPLSTIVMGIGNLENTKVDERPEARHNCYKILKDEAQHLMKLVDKVLTISKLEEGKLHINKEEVELRPMIADLEEKFSVKARKPLRFQNSIGAEVAYAEEEYLSEAISNLIDNAIKYSGDKPETVIEISSRRTPSGVQISVRDNGMGISKADQKVIFDKFERASASGRTFTKNGPAGFGLGLNYVLQVVEAHGGVVGVDSVVGEYSEFTLLLPNAEDEEEETVNIL